MIKKRNKICNNHAISFDIMSSAKHDEIKKIMTYIINEQMSVDTFSYTIEYKESGMPHLHCYANGIDLKLFEQKINLFLSDRTRMYCKKVYDLDGWLNYMGKSQKIINLRNSKNE